MTPTLQVYYEEEGMVHHVPTCGGSPASPVKSDGLCKSESVSDRDELQISGPQLDWPPSPAECDCENPEPEAGVALCSDECPIHGFIPGRPVW